ncbi:MAG: aminoacyl-tRNA hydrolase, partial [Rhodothermales bacterium]|nr:aminoacyl-tRNA hydrolase [Rhodothermales bacterium]
MIVGLGNPGKEYAATRHNIGFTVVDRIAEKAGIPIDSAKFNTVFGRGSWRGRPFAVAKPTAFMNRSGKPVSALLRHFNLSPS